MRDTSCEELRELLMSNPLSVLVRIAYVEFYTPESVLMALAMSNQQIRGQTIMINASQAEKNRIAAANKHKK